MITEDILLDKMIDAGACNGLDKKNCIKSLKLVFKFGDAKLSLVKAIMKGDFDRFSDNYRAAIDKIKLDPAQVPVSNEEIPAESPEPTGDPFINRLR